MAIYSGATPDKEAQNLPRSQQFGTNADGTPYNNATAGQNIANIGNQQIQMGVQRLAQKNNPDTQFGGLGASLRAYGADNDFMKRHARQNYQAETSRMNARTLGANQAQKNTLQQQFLKALQGNKKAPVIGNQIHQLGNNYSDNPANITDASIGMPQPPMQIPQPTQSIIPEFNADTFEIDMFESPNYLNKSIMEYK